MHKTKTQLERKPGENQREFRMRIIESLLAEHGPLDYDEVTVLINQTAPERRIGKESIARDCKCLEERGVIEGFKSEADKRRVSWYLIDKEA